MNEILEYQYCDSCQTYKPMSDFRLKDNLCSNICVQCLNEKSKSMKPIEDIKKELETQETTQSKSL
jgi:hypothetical protein